MRGFDGITILAVVFILMIRDGDASLANPNTTSPTIDSTSNSAATTVLAANTISTAVGTTTGTPSGRNTISSVSSRISATVVSLFASVSTPIPSVVTTTTSIANGQNSFLSPTAVTATVAATTTTSAAIPCSSANYYVTPSTFNGVYNATVFKIDILFADISPSTKQNARANYNGYEMGCGFFSGETPWESVKQLGPWIYLNSSMSSDKQQFTLLPNMACLVNVFTSCGTKNDINSNPDVLNTRKAWTGFSLPFLYPGNMTAPLTSQQIKDTVNNILSAAPSSSNTVQTITTISNLAASIQSSTGAVNQTQNDQILQVLAAAVTTGQSATLASNAPAVLDTIKTLVGSGKGSGKKAVEQAFTAITSVLTSLASSGAAPILPQSTGNNVVSTIVTLLQASTSSGTSSSSNNGSITASLNLLSQIAASQADINSPFSYSDPTGAITVTATRSIPSNLASIASGNTTFSAGNAFTSLLSTVSTAYVTSRIVASTLNPYASLFVDDGNSSRSGVFQYSLFDDQGNAIAVKNLAQNFSMGFALANGTTSAMFTNATVVPNCQYWNASFNIWSTDGCYYDTVNSNSTYGYCKCNHLTAFSINFSSIVPNALDPVADAALATHAGLIYLIACALASMWMILVALQWRRSRNMFFASNDYTSDDFAAFKVQIRTNTDPQTSVSARTYITLHGEKASTEKMMLSHGMAAGANFSKTLIAANVGAITSIQLSHDQTGPKTAWNPLEILVANINIGTSSVFVNQAIITSAPIDLQATKINSSALSFASKARTYFMINLQERHVWISTIAAPSASRFSHTERVAMCFLLLFGNLGLGFWFHKNRSYSQELLDVILVAIITSGIMLAMTLPLMYIYRQARRQDATEVTYQDYEKDPEGAKKAAQPSQGSLSVLWRHVAWVLTVVFTLGALVLGVFAALYLDAHNVSALVASLQSAAISILESWLISSPLVVAGRSLWDAQKKKDVDVSAILPKSQAIRAPYQRSEMVQSSANMNQWSPESIYPTTTVEPPITSNGLSSAIMPVSRKNTTSRSNNQNTMLGV